MRSLCALVFLSTATTAVCGRRANVVPRVGLVVPPVQKAKAPFFAGRTGAVPQVQNHMRFGESAIAGLPSSWSSRLASRPAPAAAPRWTMARAALAAGGNDGQPSRFREMLGTLREKIKNQGFLGADKLLNASKLEFLTDLKKLRYSVERSMDEFLESYNESQSSLSSLLAPLAVNMRAKVGISLYDASARKSEGGWTVPIHAWMFRQNEGRHVIRLALCQKFLIEIKHGIKDLDAAAQQRYEERGRLIFRNIVFRGGESKRKLEVRFGSEEDGDEWREVPTETDGNGRIITEVHLSDADAERFSLGSGKLAFTVRCSSAGPAEATATANLIDDRGLSIISDIDDTVKVTGVFHGNDVVVRNTFFEEFLAVRGMAELYTNWSKAAAPNIAFHYVSNSPPELMEPLRDFLQDEGFPLASMYLRPLKSKRRAFFKADTIESLITQYPMRRFILVGDSTESDAMIYADISKRYPGNVAKILIREVDPTFPVNESAFSGVDPSLWEAFEEPSEVHSLVRADELAN